MNNIQLLSFKSALEALSIFQKEIDGKVVALPYQFNGNTRMKIAKNINTLVSLDNFIQNTHRGIVKEICPEKGIIETQEQADKIDQHMNQILLKESDISLNRLSEQELFLDRNPIPSNVLAALLPLID